jgi:hypothetical protein
LKVFLNTPFLSTPTVPGTSGPTTYPLIWQCNFDSDFNDTCKVVLVGITNISPVFTWSRITGPTVSGETGPETAYDGDYYIYLEASGQVFTSGMQA